MNFLIRNSILSLFVLVFNLPQVLAISCTIFPQEKEAQAVTDVAENWTNQHYLDMVTPYPAGGVIESYGFLNDSTVFVVVNGVQQTYTFPENGNLPIVVQGANNVEIQFWPDGTIVVTTYGTTPSADHLDATADRFAEFEAVSGQEKFFDKKQYDHFASNYELISCENNFNYFVSNTAIAAGAGQASTVGTTQVKAVYHVRTPGYSASGVSFKLGGGYSTVAHTQENDTTFVLTLPEKSFSYDVYAFYGDLKIGKIRVVSLEQKERKVRIVPLVAISQSESAIEQTVNSIYAPANVIVDVKIDSVFSTAEFTAQTVFSDPEVDGMQKYTAQMRTLRDAYKETHELASNEYLLFVIPGFETAAIDGYMVRGKGLGFVKINSNLVEFVHTMAHELGHGMGGLSHVWVTSTGSATDVSKKGLTTNLLDYSTGTKLIKAQWEDLNAAPNVVSIFDGEEEGQNYTVSSGDLTAIYSSFANQDGTISFVDPAGSVITLPQGVTSLTFASPDSYWTNSSSFDILNINETPIGSLMSFTTANGKHYISRKSTGTFLGYYEKTNTEYIPYPNPATTNEQINHILGGFPVLIDGNVKFKICPLNKSAILANTNTQIGGGFFGTRFEFLNNYVTSTSFSSGIVVIAQYQGGITNSEIQYLKNLKSTIEGQDVIYAFQLAYLLKKNPRICNCFTSIVSETALQINNEQLNQLQKEKEAQENQFFTQAQDGIQSIQHYEIFGPQPQPILNLPNTDPAYFQKIYTIYLKWIENLADLQATTSEVIGSSNIDIGGLSNQIYSISTPAQRKCYLSQISSQYRIKLLKEVGEWTLPTITSQGAYFLFTTVSFKEQFFVELLESTPENQYGSVLDALSLSNYQLLKDLDGDLWNDHNYKLYAAVALMAKKYYDYETFHVQQELNTQGKIIEKIGDIPLQTVHLTNSSDFEMEASWSGGNIYFRSRARINNSWSPYQNANIDPYTPVKVIIENDFNFAGANGAQLKHGDVFICPAAFAYWLVEEKDKLDEIHAVRVTIDAIVVTMAVLSANPSPLLVADAIVGGIDLIFAQTEQYIQNSGSSEAKEMLAAWNTMATAFGLVSGVAAITKTTTQGLKFVVNRSRVLEKIKSLKNNELALDNLHAELANLYSISKQNMFSAGYTKLKAELGIALREVELTRQLRNNANAELKLASSGDNNILQITHSGQDYNLAYIDPLSSGEMVYSNLSFGTSADVQEILAVLEDVNYVDASGQLNLNKKLSIIKTYSGEIKIIINHYEIVLKLNQKSNLNLELFNQLENSLNSAQSIKFNYGSFELQSPKQFLNEVGNNLYDIVFSNGSYAKFDNATGRLLYYDGTKHYFVHYETGNNVSNVGQLLKTRVELLRNYLGLNGPQSIQLINGLGSITTSTNKVTTFIGKTTQTIVLKNQFGNFKHYKVGESTGAINLLNMPDPYWNPATWFEDYNKDWMLRAIQRGDDIYIASPINESSLLNETQTGVKYGSYFANELNECVKAGVKPKNISQVDWNNLIPSIIDAASKKP